MVLNQTMFFRLNRLLALAGMVCSLSSLTACDANRAAREAAQTQLAEQEAQIVFLQRQQREIQTELSNAVVNNAALANSAQRLNEQSKANRTAFRDYVYTHQWAVASVTAMTGVSVIALDPQSRQTVRDMFRDSARDGIDAAGVFGGMYCVANMYDCAMVLQTFQSTIQQMQATEQQFANLVAEAEKIRQRSERLSLQSVEISQSLAQLQTASRQTRAQIQALQCIGPLCGAR